MRSKCIVHNNVKKFFKQILYWFSQKHSRKDWSLYKRELLFLKQRRQRGFSDDETWSLYNTFSEFIKPRLVRYKEIDCGVPGCYTQEQWHERLDKMIFAFTLINTQEPIYWSEIESEMCKEGLQFFSEDFLTLWW